MLLWHIVDATRRIGSAGVQPERLGWPVNCPVHSLAPAAGFSCWRSLLNASAITAQSEKLIVQFFDEVATLNSWLVFHCRVLTGSSRRLRLSQTPSCSDR